MEELVGELEEDTGAVSGVGVAATAAAMVHVAAHFEDSLDQFVGARAFKMAKKADSAGIVFVPGVVEALCGGKSRGVHMGICCCGEP